MTTKIKFVIVTIFLALTINESTAQWLQNGNFVTPGQFLGSTNNEFLDFHQNNTRRVRHTNVNWPGYNNAVAVPNSSRIHFSLDGNNQLPFSMMHLGSALSTTLSRPWMHVGTTYGAGGDIMHVGIMQSPDPSGSQQGGDAVIAWGDNDDGFSPQQGPDNLRFLFISPSNINNPGANSAQGRETMRITPMGNVGIGDFSTMPLGIGGTYGQPRARLDVQFFSAIPQNTENTAVNVLNNAIDPTGPFSTEKIGIRSESIATGIVGFAIGGRFRAERGVKTAGVWAEALGSGGGTSYGVYGSTIEDDGEIQHYGIYGEARLAQENVGVYGVAGSLFPGAFAAGVRGVCSPAPNSWAGYFDGTVFMSNGYVLSDEQLKTDITPIENASDLLGQLSSNSYFFNQDQSQLNLEASLQYGLLAQEIEEILPSLVTTVTTPTKFNDAGEVVAEPFTFKAVRYNDFIALLIAGFNEQQVAIGAQAAEIAEQTTEMELKNQELELLQNQLHEQDAKIQAMEKKMIAFDTKIAAFQQKTQNCCQQENQGGQGFEPTQKAMPSPMELDQNIPNPFESATRIDFYLPADAEVILEISDAQGRPLRTLIDGKMGGGNHTTTFDGSGLAAGIYYYSLYANGELITKRMMKL